MNEAALKRALRETLWDNPMHAEATRAMRRFLRTGADTGKVTNYVMLGIIAIFYVWILAMIVRSREDVTMVTMIVELLLITLILPMSVYNAISGERERQTWESLILTRLTPGQIIAGKLMWRMGLALLLMGLMTVPIVISQSFAGPATWQERDYGGALDLTNGEAFIGQTIVFSWAMLLSSFGLWVSASSRRSISSLAVIIGGIFGALIVVPSLLGLFIASGSSEAWDVIGFFHPFIALSEFARNYDRSTGWFGRESVQYLPLFYLVVSGWLLYATHVMLRRLEEPRRR